MSNTLSIHWIVTTHGTWLHGDPRGSWHRGKLIGPDPFLHEHIRARMTHDAIIMSRAETALAAESFGNTARERRHIVLAATVQPTHAHLVFAPLDEPINTVIARLKRRSAVAVFADRRQRGLTPPKSLWTAGQFPVFIFDLDHLHNAIAYVRRHNERAGLPADPYEWITPHRGQNGPAK